jgi:hypothetical protein
MGDFLLGCLLEGIGELVGEFLLERSAKLFAFTRNSAVNLDKPTTDRIFQFD